MILEYNNDYLISIDEACESLHCGKSTIYALLQAGELEGFRLNRRWKIPRDSIKKFIITRSQKSSHAIAR